jgi:hypothetical protein
MALVNDDEVEEVGRILPKERARFAILRRPTHEGLENGKEDGPIRGHPAFSPNVGWLNPNQGIL